MTDTHDSLSRNMKLYRALLGLSQAELAERAGLSAGYVGEMEIGRKFPAPDKLEAIARALGQRPFRLLMGPEDVTDAMGPEAAFETAEKLKRKLCAEIDAFVQGADPDRPAPPAVFRDSAGRPLRRR